MKKLESSTSDILNSITSNTVYIYGYYNNRYSWKSNDNRTLYRTSGLIVNLDKKKYVITTRNQLISCQKIIMHHILKKTGIIVRCEMQVLFQSIESDLIILGSKEHNELIITEEHVAFGVVPDNFSIGKIGIDLTDKYVTPTLKSSYHLCKIDMDDISNTIKASINRFDVKFVKSCIIDDSYIPRRHMFVFDIVNCKLGKNKFVGITGSFIYNKKNKIVGMVNFIEKNRLYVTPIRVVSCTLRDFNEYHDQSHNYQGQCCFPLDIDIIDYKVTVTKQKAITIANSSSSKKIIKVGDLITSINDLPLSVVNDEIVLQNENGIFVYLDIYFRQSMRAKDSYTLTLSRNSKIINIVVSEYSFTKELYLTDQSYFYPKDTIPYYNIFGIIIVKLTHELINYLAMDLIIKNILVEKIMEQKLQLIEMFY